MIQSDNTERTRPVKNKLKTTPKTTTTTTSTTTSTYVKLPQDAPSAVPGMKYFLYRYIIPVLDLLLSRCWFNSTNLV